MDTRTGETPTTPPAWQKVAFIGDSEAVRSLWLHHTPHGGILLVAYHIDTAAGRRTAAEIELTAGETARLLAELGQEATTAEEVAA